MAKKDKATTENGESRLDRIFKPFLPSHHVAFSQLKDILSKLTSDDDDKTSDETPAE
jgi:hypothetical protein